MKIQETYVGFLPPVHLRDTILFPVVGLLQNKEIIYFLLLLADKEVKYLILFIYKA